MIAEGYDRECHIGKSTVIYGTTYHPPNLNVPYDGNLSRPEALFLQGIATQAIRRNGLPRSVLTGTTVAALDAGSAFCYLSNVSGGSGR